MSYYLQQQAKKRDSILQRRGQSNQFEAFKDQHFNRSKQLSPDLIKTKCMVIGSINKLQITQLRHQTRTSESPLLLSGPKQFSVSHQKVINPVQLQQTRQLVQEGVLQQSSERCLPKSTFQEPRYTRTSNSDIKIVDTKSRQYEEVHKRTNHKISVLKRILEHYNTKSVDHSFESNLINKLNASNQTTKQGRTRTVIKKYIQRNGNRKEEQNVGEVNRLEPARIRIKSQQQGFDFFSSYFDQNNILIEAQGLNQLIKDKQENRKKNNLSVNDRELFRQKYNKKVAFYCNPQKKAASKYQTLPTQKIKYYESPQTDNTINIKVNKYKEFLFMINFANRVYRELDISKYEFTFKIFVGKGNNSNLVKAILKRRFWFQIVKNIDEAHFGWTQLKEQSIYQRQKVLNEVKMQKKEGKDTMVSSTNKDTVRLSVSQVETRNTVREQAGIETQLMIKQDLNTDKNSYAKSKKDNKNKKIKQRAQTGYQPETRILTKEQLVAQRQLMDQIIQRKKSVFNDRIPYLKGFPVINIDDFKAQLIHNHLPVNGLLGNKKAMFYMLRQYYKLTQKDIFQVVPLTFHIKKGQIDDHYRTFMNKFVQNRLSGQSNYWIIKPGQFSNRGQGISCTNKIEEIRGRISKLKGTKDKSLIIQKYLTNPLLYNGRKFDIRTYMLLAVNNKKIRGYWYQEGYIRTSSFIWSLEDISDKEIHLTNDAIQKFSADYGKYEPGNKLTYSELQRYLDSLPRPPNSKSCNFQSQIYPKLKQIATDAIKASFTFIDPERNGNNFQLFGFDFMIDSHLKPWLVEINTNPCLQTSCPVLNRIIPSLLQNVFRIGLDPIFPPPMNYSSTYKYGIPENALHYNKFQLIFDEDKDGPSLSQLYQNCQVVKEIDEYEQDQETYVEEGEEEVDLQES